MKKKKISSFIIALIIVTGCAPALASNQVLQTDSSSLDQNIANATTTGPAYECENGICPVDAAPDLLLTMDADAVNVPQPTGKFKITIFGRPNCMACEKAKEYISALITDGHADKWKLDIVDITADENFVSDDNSTVNQDIAGRKNLVSMILACRQFGLSGEEVPVIIVENVSGYAGFDRYSAIDIIAKIEADMIEYEAERR